MSPPYAHTPDRLTEEPPAGQFCDVVLNGGVASGVVYPWALLKLARHYRFKSIGGNSVGAMAAAMAAAAEYGRCHGVQDAFEPLRRMPLELAEEEEGGRRRTKMLRLFQPSPAVRRLFDLFLVAVHWSTPDPGQAKSVDSRSWAKVARIYELHWPVVLMFLVGAGAVWLARGAGPAVIPLVLLGILGAGVVVLWIVACRLYRDLQALAANNYGLCRGRGQGPGEEGLVEWLHKGIQLSAGRTREDAPLTFADLWAAPRFGRAGPVPLPGGLQPPDPGIDLQMFASNVTLGRPVRLPLNDANTALYYDPQEWATYFPPSVMSALLQASSPYRPRSISDPDPARSNQTTEQVRLMSTVRELPVGDMPLVVAARLSLCFPVLFCCVPVYAVNYEAERKDRELGRCLLSDGGLCTNFPIHLFDAAHPRWPTFAFLLDRRLKAHQRQDVWLPETHLEGRGDNWQTFVPGAEDKNREDGNQPERSLVRRLVGLLGGMLLTTLDWNDRVTGRLPHVRNRIIRLALKEGEGQLNLDMPGERILRMAHVYGTRAGSEFVKAFAPNEDGVKPAWREHLYVRSMIEIRALRRHLRNYSRAVHARGSTVPLSEVLATAVSKRALVVKDGRSDPSGAALSRRQAQAISQAVQAVEALEAELSAGQFGPYTPILEPELRLRPPI